MILDQAGSQLFYHRDQKNLEFVDSDQIYKNTKVLRIIILNSSIYITNFELIDKRLKQRIDMFLKGLTH